MEKQRDTAYSRHTNTTRLEYHTNFVALEWEGDRYSDRKVALKPQIGQRSDSQLFPSSQL